MGILTAAAVLLILFSSLLLTPTHAHAAPCHEYTRASQTPAGYAPPVSWYTNTLLLSADCTGTQATLTVGDNSPTTYIYDTAYYHTGTSWVPLTLTGTGKQGRWIPRKATASFTLPQPATYVAAYTCEWQGNTWRCGCTTPACTQRAWQLQRVRGEASRAVVGGSARSAPGSKPFLPTRSGLPFSIGVGQPFGVSPGDAKSSRTKFVKGLGRMDDIVKVWSDPSSIKTWDGIAGGKGSDPSLFGGQFSTFHTRRAFDPRFWPVDRPIVIGTWMVPLSHSNRRVNGKWQNPGIWREIAAGKYDTYYYRMGQRLAYKSRQTGRKLSTVVLRLGWEMTGSWYPHSIGTDVKGFKRAWRRAVDAIRSGARSIAGEVPLFEFGPSFQIRYGDGTQRHRDVYPGDAWVDICGVGIHDKIGIRSISDWNRYLRYPALQGGEGLYDWFDFCVSRGKWVGSSEFGMNRKGKEFFPITENPAAMVEGVERLRQRYQDKFVYLIYLWSSNSALWDGNTPPEKSFGAPFRAMWGR